MKKLGVAYLLVFVILVPLAHILSAQEPTLAWVARYDTYVNDHAYAAAIDRDGNVYVTGRSYISPVFNDDFVTIKYDNSGKQLWLKRYNGPGSGLDMALDVVVDEAANVYVTGMSWGGTTSQYDYATIKYDTNGNLIWAQRYNGSPVGEENPFEVAVDQMGNVYVTGRSWNGTDWDYATVKYDALGNELWAKRYGIPGGYYESAYGIALDQAGNAYVTGASAESRTGYFTTIKYDSYGNEVWIRKYCRSINSGQEARDIAVDSMGNVYVTGDSAVPYNSDYLTIKYDSDGVLLWAKLHDGAAHSHDHAFKLAVDGIGNCYVTGSVYDPLASNNMETVKYDTNGNEIWFATYNGPGNTIDGSDGVAVDQLGNVYITGYSTGVGTGYDITTIKYSSSGIEKWVARYNGTGNANDEAFDIIVDKNANVYVTGYSGGPGISSRDYITIKYSQNAPPIAEAGEDRILSVGELAQFDGSGSVDPDGMISNYEWDFGDGTTATGAIATHAYSQKDTFTVTLTVTDDDGGTAEDTLIASVVNCLPIVVTGPDISLNVGQAGQFDGSGSTDSDGTILSYSWDFGDGSTATGANVTHSYSSKGSFVVTLTVTDDQGATATGIMIAAVVNSPPVANAGADMQVPSGQPAQFDGSGSSDPDGTIVRFTWDFGDGTIAYGQTATHVYMEKVAYPVTLTVTDNDGATASDTMIVTVINTPPVAEAGADLSIRYQDTAQFDGSGSSDDGSIVSYVWDFGDGSMGAGAQVGHHYQAPGIYTVLLTVADVEGAIGTDTARVEVLNSPPVADAGPDRILHVDEEWTFDGGGSMDPDGNIASMEWNFGDGTTASGSSVAHTYRSKGTFTVTLTVSDDFGATGTDTAMVEVVNSPPVANAGLDQIIEGTGQMTSFTLSSAGSNDPDGDVITYAWTANGIVVGNKKIPTSGITIGAKTITARTVMMIFTFVDIANLSSDPSTDPILLQANY